MITTTAEPRLRVHGALAAVAVLFSLNYIVAKIALRDFNPFAFCWLRVFGSALLLSAVLRLSGQPLTLPRAELRPSIFYALLGVVINQLMFVTGLSMTTAHEAAVLITTIPIFTFVGAVLLRTESVRLLNVLGILVAGCGALLILDPFGSGNPNNAGSSRLLGDVLILINCASYGLYLVVSKGMMRRFSVVRVIAQIFVFGTLLLLPFCIGGLLELEWAKVPLRAWLALIGVIVGPTVGAYLLNGWALARATSTVVAAYTYAQPFLASLLAAAILGETLGPIVFVAAALIIAGVFLASRGTATTPLEPPDTGL